MNKLRALDLIALAALVAVSGATLVVYPHLPDPMPTHFDLHGRADGWSSRAFGAWFAPALAAASWGLSRALRARGLSVATAFVSLFLVALHVLVLRAAGLVRSERRGTSIVYTLQANVIEELASELLDLAAPARARKARSS